jgi:probable HAF family extracellular repeat protein
MLPKLPGAIYAGAYAINNSGVTVGCSSIPGTSLDRAVLWSSAGVIQDLGTLDPTVRQNYQSGAEAINNSGEVVGVSQDAVLGDRAVVWKNGVLADLNTLIPPTTGWALIEARTVNDSGQIAGIGTYQGQKRAFLLTPVVPSARQAVGVAGGLIATSPTDVTRLHGAPSGSVGIMDAVRLARRASGLDP